MTKVIDRGQPEWFDRAKCRKENIPTEVFFKLPAKAVAICQQCETMRECRELANINGESAGVWGGQLRERSSAYAAPLARTIVRRRLPDNTEAAAALARLSIPELMVLAEREGLLW